METITTAVFEVDTDLGTVQIFGLARTAPVTLVKELATYALATDKGYRTAAALTADGYEFCPEGPGWWDGDSQDDQAGWAWDFNRAEAEGYPAYYPQR